MALVDKKSKLDRNYREVSREDAENFAKENNLLYFETSAKKDINVHECYKKIIKHNEDAYRNSLIFYPLSGFNK